MFFIRMALGFLGLVILIFTVIAGGTLAYTTWLDSQPATSSTPPSQPVASRRGMFDRYSFELTVQGADAVAIFEPHVPLSADDVVASGVVALAAEAVTRDAFATSFNDSTLRQAGDALVAVGANGRTYVIVAVRGAGGGSLQAVRVNQQ